MARVPCRRSSSSARPEPGRACYGAAAAWRTRTRPTGGTRADLVALIRIAARNADQLDRLRRWLAPARRPVRAALAPIRTNTRRRSRRHIAAHYDLGNELFLRMLDETMTYSCAMFESPRMSLEEAQTAKLEAICRKLDLRADDRLLEIGTGWGSLALHAAATRECHVTTTTISAEQHAYAESLIRQAGLANRVTVLLWTTGTSPAPTTSWRQSR
jgi:cyclopropane-fatty-acyl-phospholipid synthase